MAGWRCPEAATGGDSERRHRRHQSQRYKRNFRELAREHGRYEQRLSELSSLQYPSDEEQLEEVTLKKKKLAVKDQMHAIMLKHQHTESTAH